MCMYIIIKKNIIFFYLTKNYFGHQLLLMHKDLHLQFKNLFGLQLSLAHKNLHLKFLGKSEQKEKMHH